MDTPLALGRIERVGTRYRLGAHSYVYEGTMASDTVLSAKVAIKVFKICEYPERDEILSNALKELSPSWSLICHPHIARFLGLSDEQGENNIPAMVYDYYDNGSIMNYLANKHGTDDTSLKSDRRNAEATMLMAEVADGLKYLHQINVVHTNIRGNNILIDNDCHARVSDVGMVLAFASQETNYLDSIRPAGLCRWTSPELLDNLMIVKATPTPRLPPFLYTPAVDVYAYGMLLVEVFSGRPPFTPPPRPGVREPPGLDASVIIGVLKGARPQIPLYLDNNAVLRELVTRCWDTEPAKRPAMSEVCEVLATLPSPGYNDPPSLSRRIMDSPIFELLRRILTWPINRLYRFFLSVLRFLKFTNQSS